jgi:hypothetical protein
VYNLSSPNSSVGPDHDLGARFILSPPYMPWLRGLFGVFNGEGRNQVENINNEFLYAARIEYTPIGWSVPLQESAFFGDYATVAISTGHNNVTQGGFRDHPLYLGADFDFAVHGLSGSFEYLEVRHTWTGDPTARPADYRGNGFNAQLNYLLPFQLPPRREARFEIGFRVEEIDPNDAVPIVKLGDPTQSERIYTAVMSYYLRRHILKAQLIASHFTDLETKTATGMNATYPHDQVLLQVQYKLE